VKIEEIVASFFKMRNYEENILKQLELLYILNKFMKDRNVNNDFKNEDDIKNVASY
jgi:hypothetical protein